MDNQICTWVRKRSSGLLSARVIMGCAGSSTQVTDYSLILTQQSYRLKRRAGTPRGERDLALVVPERIMPRCCISIHSVLQQVSHLSSDPIPSVLTLSLDGIGPPTTLLLSAGHAVLTGPRATRWLLRNNAACNTSPYFLTIFRARDKRIDSRTGGARCPEHTRGRGHAMLRSEPIYELAQVGRGQRRRLISFSRG